MKYLKKYEDVNWDSQETGSDDSWKLGSYVLISDDSIKNNTELDSLPKPPFGRVVKWRVDEEFPFDVKFVNGHIYQFAESEIKRYLTDEEIKQFKLEKETNKYNL